VKDRQGLDRPTDRQIDRQVCGRDRQIDRQEWGRQTGKGETARERERHTDRQIDGRTGERKER
jgi:hypothetical protein